VVVLNKYFSVLIMNSPNIPGEYDLTPINRPCAVAMWPYVKLL